MAKVKIPPSQPTPKALTLDQVTIVWNDGKKDHRIEGRHVALALALAYGEINNGLGCWSYFTDEEILGQDLERLADLARSLSGNEADDMDSGLTLLSDNLRRVRLRMTIAKGIERRAASYRVEATAAAGAVAVMAAAKTWTDREVLDLVRAVLVVRDAGLMQRMQNVWSGGDSAPLSPLSEFFKGQARRYDLFGFGHEAFEQFWTRITAALGGVEDKKSKIALKRQVRETLRRAASHRAVAAGVTVDQENQAWLWRQLEGLDAGRA